jgi:hypothetical protein
MRNFLKNSPLFRKDVLFGVSLLAPERRRQTVPSEERGFVVLFLLFAMRRSRFVFFFDDIREQRKKGSILFNRIPREVEEEI